MSTTPEMHFETAAHGVTDRSDWKAQIASIGRGPATTWHAQVSGPTGEVARASAASRDEAITALADCLDKATRAYRIVWCITSAEVLAAVTGLSRRR